MFTYANWNRPQISAQPGVNIYENASEVLLEIEVAGRKKEEISVEVIERELQIKASDAVTAREGFEASYCERKRGAFERGFKLGADLDASKVQARYENGLLLLSIPKFATAQPRKVEIL